MHKLTYDILTGCNLFRWV